MATIKNGKKGAVSRPVTANVAPTEDYKAIEYIEDVKKVIDYIKEKTNNYDISLLKLDSSNVNIINEIFKRLYNGHP
jgi:2-phosphoglycerate kinase